MAWQRDFLRAVGANSSHEVLRVESSVFAAESLVTASSIAVQIAFLFDRTPAVNGAAPVELPGRTLAELQQWTLDRVRRYGSDVIASQTLPARPGCDPQR